jgi:hypothetical protein
MPSITDVELYNPKHCHKNWKLGPKNLEIDFSVKVEQAGCYAIAVTLLDDDDLSGDDIIASNLEVGKLPCLCFKEGETRKFAINGGDGPTPTPEAGRTQLDPITGQWPASDGPFDDTLELYATIELYLCKQGPCTPNGCRWLNCGRLSDFTSVTTYSGKEHPQKTEIVDGEGWAEGMGLIEKAASAGGSLIPKTSRAELRTLSDPYLATMLHQRAELEKGMRALQQRIGALESRGNG